MTGNRVLPLTILALTMSAGHALAQPGQYQPNQSIPEPAPTPTPESGQRHDSMEFMAGIFGIGMAGGQPAISGGMRVITVRWERFAWTVLDVFAAAGVSDFQLIEENSECSPVVEDCTINAETGLAHFGTRLYYKVNRDPTGQHQLWWGLGVGVLAEDNTVGEDTGGNSSGRFSLSPSIDYVIQYSDAMTLGLGARMSIGFGGRFDSGRIPFMMLVGLEVGITPFSAFRKQLAEDLAGDQ